jgi:hypothetical protein
VACSTKRFPHFHLFTQRNKSMPLSITTVSALAAFTLFMAMALLNVGHI